MPEGTTDPVYMNTGNEMLDFFGLRTGILLIESGPGEHQGEYPVPAIKISG
jgi:hypothetical protein